MANVQARAADVFYTAEKLQPYGPCHNQYFGVYAACLAGMSAVALDGSDYMRNVYALNVTRPDAPGLEQGWNAMLTTDIRFGLWDDVLNDTRFIPEGAPPTPYSTVLRHYSRGLAFLQKNKLGEAKKELHQLCGAQALIIDRAAMQPGGFNGMSVHLASVANAMLSSGVLLSEGNVDRAVTLLTEAADNQDHFHYDEPPDWHVSVQQCLGQVLLDGGRARDAEVAFRKDLQAYPQNGWGLTGLLQSVLVIGTAPPQEITELRSQLSKSWVYADVPLPTSACPAFNFVRTESQ